MGFWTASTGSRTTRRGSLMKRTNKDGEVLHCHKARLIGPEGSDYFEAMLSHKMRETSINQMEVPEYDGVTVASFLEWIYAPKFNEEVMKKLKVSAEPGEFIAQKQFDVKKFSPGIFTTHFHQKVMKFFCKAIQIG